MRTRFRFLVVVASAAIVPVGCGSVAPSRLTGPSLVQPGVGSVSQPAQLFPTVTGRWRASGARIEYRNTATGTTTGSYGCQGLLTVESQTGAAFSGTLGTDGNGYNTDRFCTGGGTLTGEMLTPDGALARARLDGGFSANQCTPVSVVAEFTGVARDTEIRLQRTDVMRCPVNMDGGPGMPLADFERTVTLAFERW